MKCFMELYLLGKFCSPLIIMLKTSQLGHINEMATRGWTERMRFRKTPRKVEFLGLLCTNSRARCCNLFKYRSWVVIISKFIFRHEWMYNLMVLRVRWVCILREEWLGNPDHSPDGILTNGSL